MVLITMYSMRKCVKLTTQCRLHNANGWRGDERKPYGDLFFEKKKSTPGVLDCCACCRSYIDLIIQAQGSESLRPL